MTFQNKDIAFWKQTQAISAETNLEDGAARMVTQLQSRPGLLYVACTL